MTPSPMQAKKGSAKGAPVEMGKKEILAKWKGELEELGKQRVMAAVDREKVYQYAQIRRNDFYYRGNQHLAPTFSGSGEIVDFKPVNGQMLMASSSAAKGNSVVYDYVLNNFRGDLRKFVGVLGQKSPNATGRPSWQGSEVGIRRAAKATECMNYLRGEWDGDAANRYLTLSLGKNGTTFIHTYFVSDGDRFGYREEAEWGMVPTKVESDKFRCARCGNEEVATLDDPPPGCIACGAPQTMMTFEEAEMVPTPQQTGTKTYPNGSVVMDIHSGYDVTTPFYIKDRRLTNCPWLWLQTEDDMAWLMDQYPGKGLEKWVDGGERSGTGGSSTGLGQLARSQASSPTGYNYIQRPNRGLRDQIWVIPSYYNYLNKEKVSPDKSEIVTTLKKAFPKGAKLTFICGDLVDIDAAKLSEEWTAVKPETSEYLYADPIFNDYIQGSDAMNDAWNINLQLMETSIPSLLFDPNILDPKKVRNGFQPNEFVPMIPGTGVKASEGFFRIPTSDPKPELYGFQEKILGVLREIVGLMPAVWGGEGPAQTAEEARRRLNQSLMVLATTWNEIRSGWAAAYENGIRQLAKYSLGQLVYTQGEASSVTTRQIEDIEELLEGGWFVECDQAIPMNWTQLKDFIQSVFTMSPEMIHTMGADDPDNMAKVVEGIGIPGWKWPGLAERNRIRDLINELMKSEPIKDPSSPDPIPSIPLDFKVTWKPDLFMAVVHDWLMSDDGKAAYGSPGYDNVIAAGLMAAKILNPPVNPPAMSPPNGGPATPGPGPTGPPPPTNIAPGIPGDLSGAVPPLPPEESPLPALANLPNVIGPPPAIQ